MLTKPSLGFIGAGKVGSTLSRLLFATGYEVRAIYSRTPGNAAALAKQVGAQAVTSPVEVAATTDLIWLTVSDNAVLEITERLGESNLQGWGVIHTSGVHEHSILSDLKDQGAMIGSLHPIFPFADIETSVKQLPGAVFGVQAEDATLKLWLDEIVAALHGTVLNVPAGQKALYHCALVFASNYGVTLYAIAERLLTSLGSEKGIAEQALNGLVGGMVENLREQGIPNALTGPLTRGDASTVKTHIDGLLQFDRTLADLYVRLAAQSVPMLRARGINTDWINEALMRSNLDAD